MLSILREEGIISTTHPIQPTNEEYEEETEAETDEED